MNLLFEMASTDLLFIFLAVVGLIILGIVIFYIVTKDKKVKPISEDERFDKEEIKELTEEQKQAKAELERVFNMMSADLENSEPAPSVIDEFEREQEENAIISYQELIKQAKAKGQIQNEDFLKEEPNYQRYEEVDKKVNQYEEILEEPVIQHEEKHYKVPVVEENSERKFKNSEFISPIFGIQGNRSSYPTVKKMEKEQKEEIDENTQFLNSLKEFRENL